MQHAAAAAATLRPRVPPARAPQAKARPFIIFGYAVPRWAVPVAYFVIVFLYRANVNERERVKQFEQGPGGRVVHIHTADEWQSALQTAKESGNLARRSAPQRPPPAPQHASPQPTRRRPAADPPLAPAPQLMVDFSAYWCGPCQKIAPLYADLSLKYGSVTFLKVDVTENPAIARAMNVSSMPTFHLFRDGQQARPRVRARARERDSGERIAAASAQLGQLVGASAEKLEELLTKHGAKEDRQEAPVSKATAEGKKQ